jgi:hypothetical protein
MKEELYYLMSQNLISYIRAKGIEPIEEPELTSDGKVKYYFEETKRLKEILTEYREDKFIQLFIGKLRQTKSEMQIIKQK